MFSYFLGSEVNPLENGDLLWTQQKYIRELLIKAKLENSKPIVTPMISNYTLSSIEGIYFTILVFIEALLGPYNTFQSLEQTFHLLSIKHANLWQLHASPIGMLWREFLGTCKVHYVMAWFCNLCHRFFKDLLMKIDKVVPMQAIYIMHNYLSRCHSYLLVFQAG